MAAKGKVPPFLRRRSRPTMAVQAAEIRRRFPQFRKSRQGDEYVWRGQLQPSESSPKYLVEVRYRAWSRPVIRVLRPKLHPSVIHVYGGLKLCLYWPEESPWKGDSLLATTILPWTFSWLGLYELWLDDGVWRAPESPHRPGDTELKEDER